jgi:hypothetical protein
MRKDEGTICAMYRQKNVPKLSFFDEIFLNM